MSNSNVKTEIKNIGSNRNSKVKKNTGLLNSTQGTTEQKYKSVAKSNLSCFLINARSIVNKRDELELYIAQENIDILGITESWLNDSILDSEIDLEGYTLLRRDRNNNIKSRGGGVLFYVRNTINVVVRDEIANDKFPECIFFSIEQNCVSTLVGICYRPPDNSADSDMGLYDILGKASIYSSVIIGDLNFPELNWNRIETLSDEHLFIKCVSDNFLMQLVDKPTRGKNILDLILCSDETLVENIVVGEPFGTSDHCVVKFELVINKINFEATASSFNYYKADYQAITASFSSKISTKLPSNDVEQIWSDIQSDLLSVRNEFIPKSRKQKKKKCKWVTKTVIKFRRAKIKAWNKYIKSGRQDQFYDVYKQKLNKSVRANNRAKSEFEHKLANNIKKDSKSFYAYVRSKQRNKVKVGPIKDAAGSLIADDKVTADAFNEYFASVFTVESNSNIPVAVQIFKGDKNSESLNRIDISEQMVLKKLSELNVGKTPGPDGIHPKLIYELRNELVKPLTKLFQLSVESGVVPQEWKDARVSPLFKKGKRDAPENYRPVSLTSIIGKILESIIKDRIVNHLDKFSLINTSQHGFTQGKSCLTNLLDFFETVTKNLDEGRPVDLVYLDFAKAFDKVPYVRLFRKIEAHGISGSILGWIISWLKCRRQKVSINNNDSDWRAVTSGVPQGSVLGPVLFLIYINDLDNGLVSKLSKFADDTKMCKYVDKPEDIDVLQRDLDSLHQWSLDWQMQFNVDKCSVIHVGHGNKCSTYKLGNADLRSSDCEKDLGVIVDNNMKFSEQCSKSVKSANMTLGLIRRTIKNKNKNVVIKLYKALVRPKLEYCIQAWRPYLRKDIDSLERVQHRATRMISECRGQDYESRLARVGLITLEDRRSRGDLIEVFKIIKGIDKVDYRNFFELASYSVTRGHRYKIIKVRPRLEIRKHFFSQRVVNSWNKLPSTVVEADTVNVFKNRLDSYWKNNHSF